MSGYRLFLIISVAGAALTPPSTAVAQAVNQPRLSRPFLSGNEAAIAGLILIAAGMGDEGLRDEAQEHRSDQSNSLARLGNSLGEPLYVLPVIGVGYLSGQISGNHTLTRLSRRAGSAVLLAGGITTALKFAVGRSRPSHGGDSDQFRPFAGANSFPSGHTTVAFAVATVIADETRDRWSDFALYGAATVTAFARVNDDRHWTSDVLAGALIGHLSARWLSRRQGSLTVGPRAVGISLGF